MKRLVGVVWAYFWIIFGGFFPVLFNDLKYLSVHCIDTCACRPSNRRYHGVDGILGWKYGKYNFGEMASWDILCRCLQAIHQPNEDKLWSTQHKIKTPEPNIAISRILFFGVLFALYCWHIMRENVSGGAAIAAAVILKCWRAYFSVITQCIRIVWSGS